MAYSDDIYINTSSDVERFYQNRDRTHSSEMATEYWKRLDKYREKLFTFLRHDGIPWNNNNAEHAIRPFASYRKSSDGQMTENGLRDYLVLLTIYQTCRYRGISFLRFLLSREKDLDRFHELGRTTYSRPSLQVYPKGYDNFPRKRNRMAEKPLFPNG